MKTYTEIQRHTHQTLTAGISLSTMAVGERGEREERTLFAFKLNVNNSVINHNAL